MRAHALLPLIRGLDVAVVISGNHNDPESWWDWSNKEKQDEYTKRFKRKLAAERTEKTDPLAMMVVNNMLLTGFDAPIEQVMYLDRKVVAHDLLQAIARVNRTYGRKKIVRNTPRPGRSLPTSTASISASGNWTANESTMMINTFFTARRKITSVNIFA